MSPHICLVWLVLRYEPCPWFVGFWGLLPLIPLLQCVNRWGFEISLSTVVNQNKEAGYSNLNSPRCSAWVTESLALTDGSFCRKQTLYILDYVIIVSL